MSGMPSDPSNPALSSAASPPPPGDEAPARPGAPLPGESSAGAADEGDHHDAPAPRIRRRMDHEKLVLAARMIIEAIGEDPNREGLRETPQRIARMYEEVFSGLHRDPEDSVKTVFTEEYDEIVLVKDIPFASMCEHHLLPFMGKAHAAYIPDGRLLGISKLARMVEVFAKRPQVQERLTNQVADLIEAIVKPKGVAVIIEASHTCMTIRGIKKPGTVIITSAMRGYFRKSIATRTELMNLLRYQPGSLT
jgi:GTP cyclohydrolase I